MFTDICHSGRWYRPEAMAFALEALEVLCQTNGSLRFCQCH